MSAEQTDPALADTAEIDDLLANEDDLVIEAVPADELEDEEEEEQDFQSVLANIKKAKDAPRVMPSSPSSASSKQPVVEDFFRNFLLTNSLTKTLEAFQTEWHELQQTKRLRGDANEPVPDVYARNQQLEEQANNLKAELAKMTAIAQKAKDSWDRFKQERDVHRMHHRRVVQEKNKLITDIKRLQAHYSKYEPTLRGLRKKYEDTSKEKMLVTIERDRLTNKVEALERQLYGPKDAERPKDTAEQKKQAKPGDTPFPPERRVNPNLEMAFDALPVENFRLQKTFKGHPLAVSGVTFHPKKPVVATTSDDRTWKLWSVPNGDLIMSGDGHRDWVSSCDFHPDGAILATASGDSTVKLWDLKATACVATYTDHTQAVWDVAFHDLGDFLASGSMDHTAKLWDIHTGRCRQTFRGHVDSVNALAFQPFSNILCTGSGDKTLSLWDIRSGMCVQTFYGHHNAVNSVCFNSKGDTIASCDSDGVAKLWDVRMVSETAHIATANIRVPLNDVSFDRSGKRLMMASEAGVIKVYSVDEGRVLTELAGHEDAVQGLALDPLTGFLASVGSDGTLRLWSQ